MKRALIAALLLAACRKQTAAGSETTTDSSSPVEGGAFSKEEAPRVGPRCQPSAQGVTLDDGAGGAGLEIGDAVAHGDGYAVAFLHRSPEPGRLNAAVAMVGADVRSANVVDLGPTPEDCPPPRLAACSGAIVAAALGPRRAPGRGGATDLDRALVLYAVDPSAAAQPIAQPHDGTSPALPGRGHELDDSMAFDLACAGRAGLVVWDESVAAPSLRGVVRAAPFEAGGKVGPARDLSPAQSDADMPRVISNGAGFLVFWLARRPEAPDSGASRADLETTGEARSYGWLEMVAVDAGGSVGGPPRRLTPTSGHITAYDVALRLAEPSHSALLVARDDGEVAGVPGGALLRVRARVDGEDFVDRPQRLSSDGLGRGPATFVEGVAHAPRGDAAQVTEGIPWGIAWVGPREDLRLLRLDADGETTGSASVEDALDEARPLLWARGDGTSPASPGRGRDLGERMLVAAPTDKTAQLRMFTCRP